jgi:hypothetical protein
VLLAAGIPVKRFLDPVPTPLVAHARARATSTEISSESAGIGLFSSIRGRQLTPPAERDP